MQLNVSSVPLLYGTQKPASVCLDTFHPFSQMPHANFDACYHHYAVVYIFSIYLFENIAFKNQGMQWSDSVREKLINMTKSSPLYLLTYDIS